MPVLRRLSYRQVYILLALLLAAAMVASASIGAFVFSPSQMALFAGEAIGLLPKRLDDALDRNVFFLLRLPEDFDNLETSRTEAGTIRTIPHETRLAPSIHLSV